jgi:hypothetical protein
MCRLQRRRHIGRLLETVDKTERHMFGYCGALFGWTAEKVELRQAVCKGLQTLKSEFVVLRPGRPSYN